MQAVHGIDASNVYFEGCSAAGLLHQAYRQERALYFIIILRICMEQSVPAEFVDVCSA